MDTQEPMLQTSREDVANVRISDRQKALVEGRETTTFQISYSLLAEGMTQHRTTAYLTRVAAKRKLMELGIDAGAIASELHH